MGDLNTLFDRYRMSVWYPIITEYTMFTAEMELSKEEAESIVA